jgi:Beta-xylosidase
MINGGLAKDLLRADMQQHILLLKDELHFEYVRFWDIYAPEMFLHQKEKGKTYNFSKLDTIFDFLTGNGLRPYVELGFKPIRLLKNVENFMVSEEREIIFKTNADYAEFLNQFLKHCVNRYGMEEVETWYFEQWKDPRYTDLDTYFQVFETAYSEIKSFSPDIKVGGAGLNRDEGHLFTEIIEQWRNRSCHPDFISLYSYPYDRNQLDSNAYNSCYSRNQNYMLNYADMAREVLHKNGFWNQELHISEWNFTVSNRNCLNDSAFKGAYLVKNLLDMYGKADIVGYWFGSDLFSEYYDTNRLLDGSGGLISKDGIRKPAFYGISFLNRLGTYILGKNNNSIITTNLHDTYSILCHHYEHPNYKYFVKEEDNIRISEISEFFDNDTVKMYFTINGVKNGAYTIKTRTVSKENGSVLDEWVRMGLSDNLNSQDIDYLERICVPRISIETTGISNNCIHLETILQANEIKHIHIYYQL